VSYQRVSIGASVVRAPIDLTGQTASWVVPDAADPTHFTRVPGVLSPTNDGWTAPIADGAPAAEFSLPDPANPYKRLYSFGTRNIKGLFGIFEHPGANDPAPAAGVFDTRITLPSAYAANEGFQLFAIGPWGRHSFAAGELPAVGGAAIGPVNIPYTLAQFPTINGLPLTQLTAADQLVALRYVGNDLTGSALVPMFAQSGGTDPVTVTMAANPHNSTLDVHIQPAAVGPRLNGTTPAVTGLSMSWSVVAAPAYLLANNNGVVLQSLGVAATDSGAITTPYGNPFTALGWNSLFTWATSQSRTYTPPPGTLPMTLSAGMIQQAEPSAGLTLDLPAGLPIVVSIDGTPLNSDGKTITIDPTKLVELALVADKTTNTLYQWNVYELVPNPQNTALTYLQRYAALSLTNNVQVPGDAFEAGKTYTIRGHCIVGGFPDITAGDLQMRNLPYAVSYLDSGVFKVAAP